MGFECCLEVHSSLDRREKSLGHIVSSLSASMFGSEEAILSPECLQLLLADEIVGMLGGFEVDLVAE